METGVAKTTGIWGIALLGKMMIPKQMANAGFTASMTVPREEDANNMALKLFAIVTVNLSTYQGYPDTHLSSPSPSLDIYVF